MCVPGPGAHAVRVHFYLGMGLRGRARKGQEIEVRGARLRSSRAPRVLPPGCGYGVAGGRVDQEAAVAVAGVTGLEAGRLEVSGGGTCGPLCLLDVAPVLRRRSAGAGESGTVAVLQTGERTDAVGVGWTQALAARWLTVAVDLARR